MPWCGRAAVDAVFQGTDARILRTAVRAPRMNAICEYLVGTLRRELPGRLLALGERHLRTVLAEYQVHYNTRVKFDPRGDDLARLPERTADIAPLLPCPR